MSLTKFVFQSQMQRVLETFGKENFPTPRMEEIWKVVKDLPDLDFIRLVGRIIGEVPIKYPPNVITFREFAEVRLKELREKKIQESVQVQIEPPKIFATADEALKEVDQFFKSLTSVEKFPEWLKAGFKEAASRKHPELTLEVETLKHHVESGCRDSRSAYVQKAKYLIIATISSEVIKFASAKTIPGEGTDGTNKEVRPLQANQDA